MKILFSISIVLLCFVAKSQTTYNFNLLPDSLKKDANYIVWEDRLEFEVFDEGKASESGKLAVCILNPNAKSYNTIYVPYRKGESVSRFEASIYDANGKFVKKLKNSEIKDISSVSDFSLFEDDRIKMAEFVNSEYPYTLVFEYERKIDGLLNYPTNYFHSEKKSMVINSIFKISVPMGFKFRFKEYNLKNKVVTEVQKERQIFEWKESYIFPEKENDLLPDRKIFERKLVLAPVNFSEGGYTGSMETWSEFGMWLKLLNNGRDKIPESSASKILDLLKDVKTEKEKVKILYDFLQNKTRYVSVQLGIGGYQPFSADYVDSKGYGDCKALSNYMYSILKLAGIKSHYTLVKAGENADDIITDFPVNQFNHVILCVPQPKDTIWLECTSQKQPFNFLGTFTDDRHVLLVTEDGGKLVKTPRYPKELNTQVRKAIVEIDAEGNAKAMVNTLFNGLYYENREGLQGLSIKDRNDALKDIYPVSGMVINSCQYIENKDEIPSVIEKLEVSFPKFASISSKRMFVRLNQLNTEVFVPKNEERKIPFQLRSEFIDIDTVQIKVPEDYSIESIPKSIILDTKFGTYSYKAIQAGSLITCIRKYSTVKSTFDASDFMAYYEYKKQISIADKAKLVFVKKN